MPGRGSDRRVEPGGGRGDAFHSLDVESSEAMATAAADDPLSEPKRARLYARLERPKPHDAEPAGSIAEVAGSGRGAGELERGDG